MKSILIQFAFALFIWASLTAFTNADEVEDHRDKIDINKNGEEYPFFKNIRDGDLDAVKNEADLKEDDKNAGLVIAALAGRDEIMTYLIAQNAKVNGFKRDDMSPLRGAVTFARACYLSEECKEAKLDEKVVKILLDKSANVDEKLTDKGVTILHLASQMENERTVKLLVAKGADVKAKSKSGMTALHRASFFHDNYLIAEILLKNNAAINAKDQKDWTPLHYATFKAHENTINLLLKNNVNKDAKNDDAKTAKDMAELLSKTNDVYKHIVKLLQVC